MQGYTRYHSEHGSEVCTADGSRKARVGDCRILYRNARFGGYFRAPSGETRGRHPAGRGAVGGWVEAFTIVMFSVSALRQGTFNVHIL